VRRTLLDINVLISLLDQDHVHHRRARQWLEQNASEGWASCPLTQNGCVRVMSQPRYANPLPTSAVIDRLAQATAHAAHQFWPDDISILNAELIDRSRVLGPRQVTDVYLLALAHRHSGRFATFDGSVPVAAVTGAGRDALVAI